MKITWHKYIVGSLDDPDISDAIELFGSDAYLVFFGVLEIMSLEFNPKNPGNCTVSLSFLKKKLRLSVKKVTKILHFFSERQRIYFKIQNNLSLNMIELDCPKYKEIMAEYAKKLVEKHGKILKNSEKFQNISDQEVEEEIEKEVIKRKENNIKEKKKFDSKREQHKIRTENIITSAISFLNKTVGSDYKLTSEKTRSLLRARLREYRIDDIRAVIVKKHKEWKGTEFERFLRPETLFGNKFESYFQQKEVVPKSEQYKWD